MIVAKKRPRPSLSFSLSLQCPPPLVLDYRTADYHSSLDASVSTGPNFPGKVSSLVSYCRRVHIAPRHGASSFPSFSSSTPLIPATFYLVSSRWAKPVPLARNVVSSRFLLNPSSARVNRPTTRDFFHLLFLPSVFYIFRSFSLPPIFPPAPPPPGLPGPGSNGNSRTVSEPEVRDRKVEPIDRGSDGKLSSGN